MNTMTSTISVRLDDDILEELQKIEDKWQSDRSETIRRLLADSLQQWKREDVLEKLRKHQISLGKASETLGISIYDMIDLAEDIDWVGYREDDIEKELERIKE